VDLAKSFERRKCNHKEVIPGDECLASVIGDSNKHRYVVATLSQPLRVKLREIPAVPIVHINRSVMVLEPPSDATLKIKETSEELALHPTASDLAILPRKDNAEPLHKKKKAPKGPNPLSVKKKAKPGEAKPSRKDQGKAKASLASERSRKVLSNEDDDTPGRAGAKRKRLEAEEQTGRPVTSDVGASKEENGGHKRKRRRKGAATTIPKPVES